MATDDTTLNLSNDQFNEIIGEFRALRVTVEGVLTRLDSLEGRFDSLEHKVDERLKNTLPLRDTVQEINSKIDGLYSKVDGLEAKIDRLRDDLSDRISVISDFFVESEGRYKRMRQRLTDLEEKAGHPV